MRTFHDFINGKQREGKRQLHMIMKILEKNDFKVEDFLDEQFKEPYIYCHNPDHNTSFKGIRLYVIGEKIAYRVQRENKTHPYGAAYIIDVDEIFNDLMSDGVTKKEKLGHKVIEEIVENINSFFKESAEAEKKENDWGDEEDGTLGMVHVRNPLGGDYSSMVFNK